jgi:hypothetical protein
MKPKTPTNPKGSGRKKVIENPIKVSIIFDAPEITALRGIEKTPENPNYNSLVRRLVREYFGIKTN